MMNCQSACILAVVLPGGNLLGETMPVRGAAIEVPVGLRYVEPASVLGRRGPLEQLGQAACFLGGESLVV
jgi:hypothetical protein